MDEDFIGMFLIRHRHRSEIKHFQDLLVDTPKHCRHKFHMAFRELCLSRDDQALLETIEKWEVPEFPLRGDQLIKELGIPKGPLVSRYYTMGKTKWKENQFLLDKEEVLEYLRGEYEKAGNNNANSS